MKPVVLLTDFGRSDTYAGVLHAVIEREAPGTPRVDLVHDIPPGDVWAACFHLRTAWPHLPPDAVVLVVVDPGVGTDRRAVAVQLERRWLVAPDNGLAAAIGSADRVIDLDAAAMGLPEPSTTFHGRDLFAPAAARLARGDDPSMLGAEGSTSLVPSPLPEPRHGPDGSIHGAVVHVDRFGNVITNVPANWVFGELARISHQLPAADGYVPATLALLPATPPATCLEHASEASWSKTHTDRHLRALATKVDEKCGLELLCGQTRIVRRVSTYSEIPTGELSALTGSSGLLEIAMNGDSAATHLGIERGAAVTVRAVTDRK